jgi:hypothetical protein
MVPPQEKPMLLAHDESPQGSLSSMSRPELIDHLRALTAAHEADGLSFRKAMKAVAADTGLTNISVRRLIDLYPDN